MIVLVTAVGHAAGSRVAAAALACAGSDAERANLLIELDAPRPARPSLVATAAARALEERLAAHLPDAAVASRGRICQVTLSGAGDGEGSSVDRIAAALPLARDSLAVVHLPPSRFQDALTGIGVQPSGVLLRADLGADRALTGLAVSDLIGRGLEVVVVKRQLGWAVGHAALLGLLPERVSVLPARAARLLA